MARRDLVVIGGSAGAVDALTRLVASLPRSIPSALLIAIHRTPVLPGAMPSVLGRHGPLPARYATDGEVFRPGHIYLAPPDHHLVVSGDRLRISRGPTEHGFRPAVDPLFRTAAREHGPRVVGVLLSGVLDDGIEGLALVKRHGGIAIVQRPEDAVHEDMPASALEQIDVDHVLPAADLGPLLARLANEPVLAPAGAHVHDVAEVGDAALRGDTPPGVMQPFACPECGGSLWQSELAGSQRFRCHVGHAFTARALVALQDGRLERALWTALRNLEEHAALRRRLAARARGGSLAGMAEMYQREAERSEGRADVLRNILIEPDPFSATTTELEESPTGSPVTKV